MALASVALLAAGWLWAGKMVVPEHIQGPDIGLYNGDYVSESAGLDTYYSYFIEVPPGTGKLRIRIFDADIGNGGAGDAWDIIQGSPSTRVRYTVINAAGVVKKDETLAPGDCPAGHPSCDDNWISFYNKLNPYPGHWELRIDQSSAVQTGGGADDINVLRIRAVDPVNGVELNLYAHSYSAFGNYTQGPGTVTYDLYPWVTCGCEADSNDFDADSASTGSSQTISTRSGSTSWTAGTSGATTWLNTTLGGFTTDSDAVDYGLWNLSYNLVTTNGFPVNWVTYSFGAWDAADPSGGGPPPSSQPEPSTFRVYYPTNADGKPAKEYMEQMVRWTSGPNPPLVGQQSVFTVTVRIVNPTPFPIEFSSTNTVTAWVPGGPAVYNGNLQLGQGSVVSQPSLGGSGFVVWNPGTVAAGDTVVMAYQVAVTPTSSGQRVPVTGWPGNNGTTATYVDGTCAGVGCTGARLAGATYTTGELCGLAVTENQLTHAALAAFQVWDDGGEAVVEWRTGSEDGTLGFRLYREESGGRRSAVLPAVIPSFLGAARGGSYRVRTGEAPSRDAVYWLEELEAGGRRIWHGPLSAGPRPAPAVRGEAWPDAGHPWRREPEPPTRIPGTTAPKGRPAAGGGASALAIGVTSSGMYRVRAGDIARLAGVPEAAVRRLIRSGKVRLTGRGRPVAWAADEKGSGLIFYGEGLDSIYTGENVYVASLGTRSGKIPVSGSTTGVPDAGATFTSEVHAEEDRLPATVLGLDPDSDYWFWDYLLAGDADLDHREFLLTAPHPGEGQARLTVRFQGASDTGSGSHVAEVLLNGVSLGTTSWQGFAAQEATFSFDAALLASDGTDTVTVFDTGVSGESLFFVDSFDLEYPRGYVVEGGQLLFRGEAGRTVLLGGSGAPGAAVYSVADPLQPVRLRAWNTASGRVVTVPEGPCVAVPPGGYLEPSSLRLVGGEDPMAEPAEYLVVAPAALSGAAGILADVHRRRGLRARVVTLESIMDSFADSIFDPRAVRSFLRAAWESWSPRPRFVVLLGPGTLDYRDLLGLGGNLMPPLLLQTPEGLYASDGLYTDFDGDGVPEIPVGRLPFTSEDQVAGWLARVEGWYGGPVPSRVLEVSDDRSGGADFGKDAAFVSSGLAAGLDPQFLSLDAGDVSTLRTSLFQELRTGVSLLQYYGHGGSDRMADEGILTMEDLDGNLSPGFPAVVTALTCALNRFELPGYPSLGAGLLDPEGGGMAAVWAPSGLTSRGDLRELGRRVEMRLTSPGGGTLGERIVEGLRLFHAPDRQEARVRLLFNLLGDPAMRVSFPPPAAPAGGPADGFPGDGKETRP